MKTLIVLTISFLVLFEIQATNDEHCLINSYHSIYRLSPSQYFNSKEIIQSSTCNDYINNKFASLLSTTEGTALASHLVAELRNDFPLVNIEIEPSKISMHNLSEYLKTNISDKTNLYFTDLKLSTSKKLITLKEGELLEFFCDNCLSYGDKNIKFNILNTIEATRVSNWLSSKVAAKISSLKASRNIGMQTNKFVLDDFVQEDMLTTEPNKFITNFEDIKFYKPNKALIKGMPITTTDVTPIQLVKYGTPVKIILKNQNISIIKNAIPHRSGSFGETVELKNPQNNKLISGKIVDFNKVLIEL